jgi:hypothetical protein
VAAALVSAAGAAAGAAAWWYCEGERRRREGEEAERRSATLLDTLASIIEGDRRPGGGASSGADADALLAQQQQQQQGGAGADGLFFAGGAAAAAAAAAAAGGGDGGNGDDHGSSALDASLARHFESIQSLSDRQALESLLPRLRAVLAAATDIEPLKERIRAMSAAEQQQDQQAAGEGAAAAAAAAPAAASAAEAKLAAWRQLARLCFTRAVGACWLVPLLDLLVRMKLHVVARHMYLESKLPGLAAAAGGGGGGGGANGGGAFGANGLLPNGGGASNGHHPHHSQLPPRLSDRAKEEFLRCDYFVEVGAVGLLRKLGAAVDGALAGVDLAAEVTPADVERLVVAAHARFEASFERCEDLWHGYLLPPGAQPVAQAQAQQARAAAEAAAAAAAAASSGGQAPATIGPPPPPLLLSPVEAAMVDELNAELRDVLADYRFVEALRAAVRHTSRASGAYIAARAFCGGGGPGGEMARAGSAAAMAAAAAAGGGEDGKGGEAAAGAGASTAVVTARPLAFVVPVVAKSSQLLFDEAHRCTRGISSLQAVLSLCASVFSFGPHIA